MSFTDRQTTRASLRILQEKLKNEDEKKELQQFQ